MNRSSTNTSNSVGSSTICVSPPDETPSTDHQYPGNPRRVGERPRHAPPAERQLPGNLIGGHINYDGNQDVGAVEVYANANVENVGAYRNMPGAERQKVGNTVIHAESSSNEERRNVGYADNYANQNIGDITIGKKEKKDGNNKFCTIL